MPQVQHRGMQASVTHPNYGPMAQIGPSTKYSGFDVVDGWTAPPLLGEHNEEVLRDWLGLSAIDIAALSEQGVI